MAMDRRAFGLGAVTWPALCRGGGAAELMDRDDQPARAWSAWKAAFLTPDGRVVDHLQQDASHSEGQGYGLVLAASLGDASAFDAIRDWTDRHLRERNDHLLNWRRRPGDSRAEAMNATDGDIFAAWGLSLGAARFGRACAEDQARLMAGDIAGSCLRADPRGTGRTVVLPSSTGFEQGGRTIVNPSYIMPRALRDLGFLVRDQRLAQAAQDGAALLAELAAGSPVPDWAEIDATGVRPSAGHRPVFGYEALRVALYLIWSGEAGHPAVQRARAVYARNPGARVPVVVAVDGGAVLEGSDLPGYLALRNLVMGQDRPPVPLDVAQGYYPATLEMLCLLVACETSAALGYLRRSD